MKVRINWHEIEELSDLLEVFSLMFNGFVVYDDVKQKEIIKQIKAYNKKHKTKVVFEIETKNGN